MATYMAKTGQVPQRWHLIDASNQVVGRLAVQIATLLRGKHRPEYTPHVDTGEFVVVINAEKIRFGGRRMAHPTHPNFTAKMLTKEYDHYTRYPGGRKVESAAQVLERRPEEILRLAVKRMLPKNKIGRHMLKKLKLYRGTEHPHQSQVPRPHSV